MPRMASSERPAIRPRPWRILPDKFVSSLRSPVQFIYPALLLVLHSRHGFGLTLLLVAQTHHLVVHLGWKHSQKRHHPLHESTPAGTKPVVLRFLHHLVHRHPRPFHEGVLRKSRNRVGVFRHFWRCHLHSFVLHAGHVVHGGFRLGSREWSVTDPLVASGAHTHSTTQTRTFVLGSGMSIAQNAHALFHA